MNGFSVVCASLLLSFACCDVTKNPVKGEATGGRHGMLCLRINDVGDVVPDTEERHPVSAAYNMLKLKYGRKKKKPADLLKTVMAEEAAEKPRMFGGSVVKLNGDTSVPKENELGDEMLRNTSELSSRKKRQAGIKNHEVELLLIIDYPLYLFWLKRNAFLPKRAKDEIIDFYSNIINAANKRYESLRMPTFRVKLVINGFIIADTPNKTPWTQLLNDSNTIDTDMALDNFTLWIQRNRASLPAHDHAMTISGFDLTRNGRAGLVGLAFQNGTCTKFSQSIVEGLKTQETATLIAHEIAHSLGSAHDGENNFCRNDNKFVMSTSISIPDRAKASHPWIFSSCSRTTVFDYIGRRTNGCTLRRDGTPQNLSPYLEPPFGQKYPADIQCEVYLGDTSKFCRTVYNRGGRVFEDMCHSMYCLNSTSNRCFPTLAHDGTSCGNKKWCQLGQCVVSVLAPSRPNNCPAGDDPDAGCSQSDCRNITIANGICCETCNAPQVRNPAPQITQRPLTTQIITQFQQLSPFRQRFPNIFQTPTFQFPAQPSINRFPLGPPQASPFRPNPQRPFPNFFNFGFNDNFDNSFTSFFNNFQRNLNFFKRK